MITLTTLPQDNTNNTMPPSSNNTQQQELMMETIVPISWKLQEKMCQSHGMAFTLQWVGIKHLRAIVCFQSDCMFCWISTWWWSGWRWRWRSCVLMTRRRGKNVVASIMGHHGVPYRTLIVHHVSKNITNSRFSRHHCPYILDICLGGLHLLQDHVPNNWCVSNVLIFQIV